MGVYPIHNETLDTCNPITGNIFLDGHEFDYEIYLFPIIGHRKYAVEQSLIKRIGNRFRNGQHCLDVTEDVVRKNIANNEYSAILFVKNMNHDDVASATLQYYDWCNAGANQIWINDLCRIAADKQSVSPVKVLFQVVDMVTLKYIKGLRYINLFVDNHKEDRYVLIGIYKKYGFKIVRREKCGMHDPENKYIIMRRRIFRELRGKSGKHRPISGKRKSRRKK